MSAFAVSKPVPSRMTFSPSVSVRSLGTEASMLAQVPVDAATAPLISQSRRSSVVSAEFLKAPEKSVMFCVFQLRMPLPSKPPRFAVSAKISEMFSTLLVFQS